MSLIYRVWCSIAKQSASVPCLGQRPLNLVEVVLPVRTAVQVRRVRSSQSSFDNLVGYLEQQCIDLLRSLNSGCRRTIMWDQLKQGLHRLVEHFPVILGAPGLASSAASHQAELLPI